MIRVKIKEGDCGVGFTNPRLQSGGSQEGVGFTNPRLQSGGNEEGAGLPVLVTGATGLLGAHLMAAMLLRGERVAGMRREGSDLEVVREIFGYYVDDPDELMGRVEWRMGDLLDREAVGRALEGLRGVVNCAAVVSFEAKRKDQIIKTNKGIATVLVEEVKRQEERSKRRLFLVHISSTSALGDAPGDDPKFFIDEETPRDPKYRHNGYSESKYRSEQVIWRAIREDGLNAVILNPGIILGPGQWTKGSSQLFTQAKKGLKFFPYGGTGYVDVRDVTNAIAKVIDALDDETRDAERGASHPSRVPRPASRSFGHRFVLVGANLRYKEFFDLVTDELGMPNPKIYAGRFLTGLAWRLDAVRSWITGRPPLITRDNARSSRRIAFFSSEKIKRELGMEFRDVRETVAWVVKGLNTNGNKKP